VQRFKEPIAAAITGEHSAGAIGAVGSRCQADDQQRNFGPTQVRDGFTPVIFILVLPSFFVRNLLTMFNQSRATLTAYDLII
jgi:hypothetical protein